MSLPYDQTEPSSILGYAKLLQGHTLRTKAGVIPLTDTELEKKMGKNGKGVFGTMLEFFYFGINPGNISAPDFTQAGLELKSTPIYRLKKGIFSSKERLVLNIINYNKEAEIVDFKDSSVKKKGEKILLVVYENIDGKSAVDQPVRLVEMFTLNDLPTKDQAIIKQDWETIRNKIKAGKAHELSEGDTQYLAACTKGASSKTLRPQPFGPNAKQRAFSLKSSYMTAFVRGHLKHEEAGVSAIRDVSDLRSKSFEDIISDRFEPFIGMTAEEIGKEFGITFNDNDKGKAPTAARAIMGAFGTKRIDEFEKANIEMKTIPLNLSGVPAESMSFPAFNVSDLLTQDWEAEDDTENVNALKRKIQKRFLLVVFQTDKNRPDRKKTLRRVMFWTMPASDLETVKKVWEEARRALELSKFDKLPKISDGKIIHVRPHEKLGKERGNKNDKLPDGTIITTQSFWLNAKYVGEQIENQKGLTS